MYILLVLFFFFIKSISACDQNITDTSNLNFNLTILLNCTKHLPIYQGKSIELEIFCGASFNISLLVNVDGEDHIIYHSYFTSTCGRTEKSSIIWRAPKDTGVILENRIVSFGDDDYEEDSDPANSTIAVRVIENSNVCEYPYVKLNEYYPETIIQTDITFDNSQACIYRLIAPQNSSFNKIMISFNSTEDIKYDRRVYRNSGSSIFHEKSHKTNNQSFVLQTFDILLGEYVSPSEVYAHLFYDYCLRGIETVRILPNEELKTIVIPPEDILDSCDFTKTSIFRIEIIDKKTDEYIIFNHDIEVRNDRYFNLYHLDNKERQIMNSTHWLPTAAFNTTGLYLEIFDKDALYTVNLKIYRLKIRDGCPYSFYDAEEFREDGKTNLEIAENCESVVYHWRIVNQHFLAKILDLSLGIEGSHRNDTIDVDEEKSYRFSREAIFFPKSGLPYDTNSRKLEVAFVRLQASHNQTTKLNFSWTFSVNCKCSQSVTYLALGHSENITSLNYPEPYCQNLQCRKHFRTDKGAIFEIHLNFFQLDTFGDHLSIYNGTFSSDLNLLEYLDGERKSRVIQGGRNINLFFESNSVRTKDDKGFHITLKTVKKPKDLSTTAMPSSVEVTTSESVKHWGSRSYAVVIFFCLLLIFVLSGVGYLAKQGKLNLIIEKFRR